nr:LuxR family transcriptional regulator [Mycobacteroides franklinii]
MSQIDSHVNAPLLVDWSELGVSGLLPTGTVTLLLADVEGSTRQWETDPEAMAVAIARLNHIASDLIAAHHGVRPVEQGEGDSFVAAFARASDAVACALQLQLAPLLPIRLRIGVHTGEVQLRDEGNYAGPTINRTARLRDLGHGGQTVLSGATEDIVVDWLPTNAWLLDLGTHQLRDLPRAERVVQLCHPDLSNDFPPLRTSNVIVSHNLPPQLTSFVGRATELRDVEQLLADNRLVTLTGAGGAGKTRLAIEISARIAPKFRDGVWYVDLAPVTDPALVAVTTARAMRLPDQPGRSTMDTLLEFVRDRRLLVVLDNCEHLLDASAELIVAVLAAAPQLTLLVTSREPIGVTGEATRRVPSLSLTDEAIDLFVDRARLAQNGFALTDDNTTSVAEICRRLDGIPLAIELAAARVRALSPAEILDGLHDRFRLLTGGARTAVRRQQTLRASVDWSYGLLSELERVVFYRLAPFLGGFELTAAYAVNGGGEIERYQVLDLLTLLVDKSLVVAENATGTTRYRLPETVRQYALEKLGESGEAETVRSRHRDHYTAVATLLDALEGSDHEARLAQCDIEIDNLRAAFRWGLEKGDAEFALGLSSALQPLWQARGRVREGLAWFDAALGDDSAPHAEVTAAVQARALADSAFLATWLGEPDTLNRARRALTIARAVDDPALLARVLAACGYIAAYKDGPAETYFAEAIGPARTSGDRRTLSQILASIAAGAAMAGDPSAAQAPAEEGRDLADAIGDRFTSRRCRTILGIAQLNHGDLAEAIAEFRGVAAEAEAAHDEFVRVDTLAFLGIAFSWRGDTDAARTYADMAVTASAGLGGFKPGYAYVSLATAALAAGDTATARTATEAAHEHLGVSPVNAALGGTTGAQAALAAGDLAAARRQADDAVAAAAGFRLMLALTARALVAIAEGDPERAERDGHDALAAATAVHAYLGVPDILECLAVLATDAGSLREAARLFGAAEGIRQHMGTVRFKVWDADHRAWVRELRNAMDDNDFETCWAEGTQLSAKEAIAYAHRGRGHRKRPSSGWDSLTPTEHSVTRLVSEGMSNKDIAARLFVSPRTVQTHLTHVYTKLGLSSRVQLVQEAARHTSRR